MAEPWLRLRLVVEISILVEVGELGELAAPQGWIDGAEARACLGDQQVAIFKNHYATGVFKIGENDLNNGR